MIKADNLQLRGCGFESRHSLLNGKNNTRKYVNQNGRTKMLRFYKKILIIVITYRIILDDYSILIKFLFQVCFLLH